jgi:hypothetical protein
MEMGVGRPTLRLCDEQAAMADNVAFLSYGTTSQHFRLPPAR